MQMHTYYKNMLLVSLSHTHTSPYTHTHPHICVHAKQYTNTDVSMQISITQLVTAVWHKMPPQKQSILLLIIVLVSTAHVVILNMKLQIYALSANAYIVMMNGETCL